MALFSLALLLQPLLAGACSCPPEAPNNAVTARPTGTPGLSISAPAGTKSFQGFSKRGIAYNEVGMANTFSRNCPGCGWAYNWGSVSGRVDSRLQYVPMLWGDRPVFTSNWDAHASAAISHGCKALFSFNEPDKASEANMEASHAVDKHIQYMNKYAGRALIGAPAVSNSGNEREGLDWLEEFLAECEKRPGGCVVDFCNVHWYSEAAYAETLFDHLAKAHQLCNNKPIWLTEFAPTGPDGVPIGSAGEISDFLASVIPRLEALDYLHAYSYFMVKQGSLMLSANTLSPYGKIYASVTT